MTRKRESRFGATWLSVLRDWTALTRVRLGRLGGLLWANGDLRVVVLALFAIDVAWIVYFGVARLLGDFHSNPILYNHKELLLTTDGGVPELFGYAQTLLIVVVLAQLARTTRQPIYAALALTFLFVLFDDAVEIHETIGRHLVRPLDLPPLFGLRRQDVGEVITWALVGLLIVPTLVFGLVRSRRLDRGNGLAILVPFGALLFCAIFVDQLYSNFSHVFRGAGIWIDMVEDGGELLSITCAAALALAVRRERRDIVSGL